MVLVAVVVVVITSSSGSSKQIIVVVVVVVATVPGDQSLLMLHDHHLRNGVIQLNCHHIRLQCPLYTHTSIQGEK